MNFFEENFFSIISLAITVLGFSFTLGGVYYKISSLELNLNERRKMVNDMITELERRVLALEDRTIEWKILEERINYIKDTLEKLVVRFENFFIKSKK